VGFLRRILGGGGPDESKTERRPAPTAAELQEAEQARERELLRADAERLDDELIQRQMRYADRAWTPPPQGGTRRSDDEDRDAEG
jgi:hypothetical protein